jgi:YHS domain-containing protein
MKKTYAAVTVLIMTALFTAGVMAPRAEGAEKKGKPQTVCPIQGGAIDRSIYTDYKGYRIYFCCGGCPEEFNKNPEKYMKKMRESGVTPEKAPVKGGKKTDEGKHGNHGSK